MDVKHDWYSLQEEQEKEAKKQQASSSSKQRRPKRGQKPHNGASNSRRADGARTYDNHRKPQRQRDHRRRPEAANVVEAKGQFLFGVHPCVAALRARQRRMHALYVAAAGGPMHNDEAFGRGDPRAMQAAVDHERRLGEIEHLCAMQDVPVQRLPYVVAAPTWCSEGVAHTVALPCYVVVQEACIGRHGRG